jgi:pectate lyase
MSLRRLLGAATAVVMLGSLTAIPAAHAVPALFRLWQYGPSHR